MSEYSPPPWRLGIGNRGSPVVRDSDNQLVATVHVVARVEWREGNAHLIRTAPELLMTLTHLMKCAEAAIEDCPPHAASDRAIGRLQRAVEVTAETIRLAGVHDE